VKTSRFSFDLPEELIAQEPAADRESARLLVLDRASGSITHSSVRDLAEWIEPGTLVVLNDTRVRKARLIGESASGKRVELLLLERLADGTWKAITGGLRRRDSGKPLRFAEGVAAALVGAEGAPATRSADRCRAEGAPATRSADRCRAGGDERVVRFEPPVDEAYLERRGHVPLPPYIRRADTGADAERYQTVFARRMGSAAAPTAGLHFTTRLLGELEGKGVRTAYITLHVGLGTFLPIRSEDIDRHVMHEEAYSIGQRAKAEVDAAKVEGRTVLAVGTTVVRTLESAWDGQGLRAGEGRTRLFITPGYEFRVVDRLFTNFHTPGSSLLVLVSAFAGLDRILEAYRQAVEQRYRFFSYGDAMLIR
jgi:S-adenosylmethionine:tRNA ribosyltransferase-isomerase